MQHRPAHQLKLLQHADQRALLLHVEAVDDVGAALVGVPAEVFVFFCGLSASCGKVGLRLRRLRLCHRVRPRRLAACE